MAKAERAAAGGERAEVTDIDLGYFTPESTHYGEYLNAVAAGGNFAILNRLIIFEQIADAFRKVFKEDLELVYEISHNLVQAEDHPEFGEVWSIARAPRARSPAVILRSPARSGRSRGIPCSSPDRTATTATSSCPRRAR